MTDTKPKSSINYLSIFFAGLALLWLFSVVRACTNQAPIVEKTIEEPAINGASEISTVEEDPIPPPAIPGYLPLEVTPCKISEADAQLIPQLLMQYFRSDLLTADGGMNWTPNPKIDRAMYKIYADSWSSRVICLQDIRKVGKATERLAIISSNYPGNDCVDCTQIIGWIKFTIEDDDPVTLVIRSSDRNAYAFKPHEKSAGQIGLAEVGPYEWAVVFSGQKKDAKQYKPTTDLLDLKDFHLLLSLNSPSVSIDSTTQGTPISTDFLFFKPAESTYYPLLFTTETYWLDKDSLSRAPDQLFSYQAKTRTYTAVK